MKGPARDLALLWVVFGLTSCAARSPSIETEVGLDEPAPEPEETVLVDRLPPPPDPDEPLSAEPVFTPFTTAPTLTNHAEVDRACQDAYPPLLRDAGIGGRALVMFFINEEGSVRRALVERTSGHAALDEAALRVAMVMKFTPALKRDEVVPVWIQLPIVFEVR